MSKSTLQHQISYLLIGILAAVFSIATLSDSVTAADATISGKVCDEGGTAVPFADIVLYHQGDFTTVTKADLDGSYSITTQQLGQLVHLTAGRLGFLPKGKDLSVPLAPNGPIKVDLIIESLPRPEAGEEVLVITCPPLADDLAIHAFVHAAKKPLEKCEWIVSAASQTSMFSTTVEWDEVKRVEKLGTGCDIHLLRLPLSATSNHEHLKLKISVKIRYNDGTTSERDITTVLSRRSVLVSVQGDGA